MSTIPEHEQTLQREPLTQGDAPAGAVALGQRRENPPLVLAGQVLCLIVPALIWFAPLRLEPRIQHMFAIGAFM
ncbi:MAG: hypothetical protein KGJ72_17040, partial [Gammaproteobacteria bacterium]|nr:hypothetical protein [Gammaproteobacteria bacterium]